MQQKFFSDDFKNFIWFRLIDLFALTLFFLGGAACASFLSFSPADMSFNTATSQPTQNLLGGVGAYFSDFMFQIFGVYSVILSLILVSWGLQLFFTKRLPFPFLKSVLLVVFLFFLGLFPQSSVFSLLPLESLPERGAIGQILYEEITQVLGKWSLTDLSLYLVVTPLCFFLFCFLVGLKGRHWLWLFQNSSRGALFLLSWGVRLLKKPPSRNSGEVGFSRPVPLIKRQARKSSSSASVEPEDDSFKRSDSDQNFVLHPQEGGGDYHHPPLDLLTRGDEAKMPKRSATELQESGIMLSNVLNEFGVKGHLDEINPGPVVTLYKLKPAPGTKSARVIGLSEDIARSMSAVSARIAVIPGYNAIGIEMPNEVRQTVYFREMLQSKTYQQTTARLPLLLGKDIAGEPVLADLSKMPHLLVAGTTGSGKSVSINTMILSLLYCRTPEQCRFIMIDPKMLELSVYDGIPHLLTPVVTDPHKAILSLKWVVREMESRYQNMSKLGVRNLDGYNQRIKEAQKTGEVLSRQVQTGFDPQTGEAIYESQPLKLEPLPLIVVIVDEMADLMLVAGKDIESAVQRLAQMARAAGIHLIMATQRPSVDVITGTIKANFPTRISFQVTSKIDSRTILGEQGAEQLLGQGDMLFMAPGGLVKRVHGPFVSDREVEKVVQYLKTQGQPHYIEDIGSDVGEGVAFSMGESGDSGDPLYKQALELVAREKKASTSFIQRHLKIGYNRAATIIEQMEHAGVISPANHVGKREVLIDGAD